MQGLADGYFVIPYTVAPYLTASKPGNVKENHPECKKSIEDVKAFTKKLLSINGKKTPADFMRKLGNITWNNIGMGRSKESLTEALAKLPEIRAEFWKNLKVSGTEWGVNQQLENAGRTIDFIEFADLLCRDALDRDESCGAHFRVEHQFPMGRRCGTTRTSPMWPPGGSRATAFRPSSTRSRSSLT